MSRGGEANLEFIDSNLFKTSRKRSQYDITLNDRGWRNLDITARSIVVPLLHLVLLLVHSDGELVVKRVNVADRLLDYFNLHTDITFNCLGKICSVQE